MFSFSYKKILSIFVLTFSVWGITSFAFATTGNLPLSEQLLQQKQSLQTQITEDTQALDAEYQRLVGPEINSPQYQSLVCLKIIKDQSLLNEIKEEMQLLQTNMLKDYVDINADIFNLLNQYSVGLIDVTNYQTQYNKLSLDIQSFYQNNKILIEQAKQNYLQRIFNFVDDAKTYESNNAELLDNLSQKISKIQALSHEFKVLKE
ncbi:MAG: hypothetical protein GXP45_02210 [bacterium]|nr:hypothetical protein [bacterium]